ncbi:ABC transporter substrate-binding protein [Ancylobacter amanitiformis]|uniref:Peptide/nickel transport system substrate-binding protein n=1 Tax=Ancylobacter amanitiformis TaxID=217069 RepID=A0ABU0LU88_9HYPH|nr:ABC transporter substrate-binding protein [Ancylobacter amanitiformis]MDQ0512273.1 peptide/nickel transport system substrate-binding protein [Ancylobacter amanitiformis]
MTGFQDKPLIRELKRQLDDGQMDRRSFVRMAALLGVSVGAAGSMAGLVSPAMAANTAPVAMPWPKIDPDAKAGGVLRIGQRVAKLDDPALYSWNEMSNQTRPIIEHLALLGPDNITRPMLLEGWEPSDDLKTWVLRVRKGVMWHNGEELTAEHVAFNLRRWCDSKLGSSNIGLSTFSSLSEETGEKDAKGKAMRRPIANGIEVIDTHTVKLNLARPVLSVPEDCAQYPTQIVHPSFKAPFSDAPLGTGPFTLKQLAVGDRCILQRVKKTTDGKDFVYWGGDVYLDEVHFFNFDLENQTAALASGTVDAIYELTSDQLELAKSLPDVKIYSAVSAQTVCCRMQNDKKPFDDIRVRQAIVKAADNDAIQQLLFPEGGVPAYNFHVAPVHPEYFPLPPLKRDVAGAKALLKEAGHADGLAITIDCGNTDGPWHQAVCEALRDQLADAGIKLAVNVVPTTRYWEIWKDTPFGITSWSHRPLGTMTLGLAYRSGVPWNESHYSNPAFDAALADAESTVGVEARKAKMEKVEKILQDDAVMVQPVWRPVYNLSSAKVHGYAAHPSREIDIVKVWMS